MAAFARGRAGRARRHDRHRGRRGRPRRDRDGRRERGPVRALPAPPAPRAGRARRATSRSASSSPRRLRARPPDDWSPGPSPETTEQARLVAVVDARRLRARRADFELRREGDVLGLAQSGLPRLRVASLQREDHRELAATLGATPRRCSTRPGSAAARPRRTPPRAADGWLEGRGRRAGSAASRAVPHGRRGPGHRGTGPRPRLRAPGGDPAPGRPGQADPVRDPRARPSRRRVPGSVRRQWRGAGSRRCRAARPSAPSSSGTGRRPRTDRREPRPDGPRRAETPGSSSVTTRLAWLPPGGRGRWPVRHRHRRPAVRPTPISSRPCLALLGAPGDASPLRAGGIAVAKHFWRSSPLRPDRAARVVAKHFWRFRPAGPGGLLPSARARRDAETGLTVAVYRRARMSLAVTPAP